MGSLANLAVEISANVARWSTDMNRMATIAETNSARVNSAIGSVKTLVAGLGVEEIVRRSYDLLAESINHAIEASAGLIDLATRTGATVENLSALAAVAKLSGTDIETAALAMQKLAKSMVDAEDGGAKTTAAFDAIGIKVKDLKGLNPDEVFLKIAQQLAKFDDAGPGKVAVAIALLGKAGAQSLPVLKDLGEVGQFNATTTTAQAEAAKEYEKDLARLHLAHEAIWRTISQQVTPVFDAFAKALTETSTSANGVKGTVDALAGDNSIRSWAEEGAIAISYLVDGFQITGTVAKRAIAAIKQTISEGHAGSFAIGKALIDEFTKDEGKIVDQVLFSERVIKQIEESHKPKAEFIGPPAPQIDTSKLHLTDKTAADLKAKYEQQLKIGQDFIAAENQAFATREANLKELYDADRISIESYFSLRQASIDKHLSGVIAAYDGEIAAAQKYEATIKGVDAAAQRTIVETKIGEIVAKEQIAIGDAAKQSSANTNEQIKATNAYADSLVQLSITLAKMRGDLVTADALEESLYEKQLKRQIRPGDTAGKKLADDAAQAKVYQDQINQAQASISLLEQREATTEGRIALEQEQGALGGFQALQALGKARDAEIAQLEVVYQKYADIAALTGDPKAIANVEALRLKLDQLGAEANPLAKKFQDLFATAFADNLDKVIHGTESVSDAFRNMAISILDEILKIEEANLAKSIFGGGGNTTGSLVGLVAGYFSGGGTAAGTGGEFASGGNVFENQSVLVGERGPEMFKPHTDGSIIPNHALSPNITLKPQIINVHDPSEIPAAMQSGAGEKAILNVISRNPSAIKNLLR